MATESTQYLPELCRTSPTPDEISKMDMIDVCNACRSFYLSQQAKMEKRKELEEKRRSERPNTFANLKSELIGLLDTDLSLMKQLLILNESIQELKWKQKITRLPEDSTDDLGEFADVYESEPVEDDVAMYQSDSTHIEESRLQTTQGQYDSRMKMKSRENCDSGIYDSRDQLKIMLDVELDSRSTSNA